MEENDGPGCIAIIWHRCVALVSCNALRNEWQLYSPRF